MAYELGVGPFKPLGRKAYGSIPHLPGSRLGPGEHTVPEGQAKIFTERARDKRDKVYVQEKLDGSCVAVAKIDGDIVALQRKGYLAESSPYEQHRLFADWVRDNRERFDALLEDGERACGEWLAQAHGTRYELPHEPFVLFDVMRDAVRMCQAEIDGRVRLSKGTWPFIQPAIISDEPRSIASVMEELLSRGGFHGALDPVEGAVWRHERDGRVMSLAKYVRLDKVDGLYLPEVSGGGAVWNWRPEKQEGK